MKFLKPLLNKSSKKASSFGQKRAQQMTQALSKATKERKQLIKKEYATKDPLSSYYRKKGDNLTAKISKLKSEIH